MKRLLPVLAAAAAVMGVLILAWPSVSEFLTACTQEEVIEGYDRTLDEKEGPEKEEERQEAVRYNEELASAGKNGFGEEGDARYASLLPGSDGIMCVIEIPSLSVRLPVYHGTADETLKKGAGHLYGSSLPVGGPSSHAVIAAHTALAGEELFTHIDEMKEGDIFLIRVLGTALRYRVDQIRIVLPEETDDLRIADGKDYVTLYTCTPYGINTHRLLVRGERISGPETGSVPENETGNKETISAKGETLKKISRLVLTSMLLMLLTALLILANASGVSAGTSGSSAIDPDRKGSLTIRYYEDVMERKPAAGARFTIYRIAGMDEEGSYVNLVRGAEIPLSASPAELLGTVRAAYGMDAAAGGYRLSGAEDGYVMRSGITDGDGIRKFADLPRGVYLAEETAETDGYTPSVPFLFSVPTALEDRWEYDIDAEPKYASSAETDSGHDPRTESTESAPGSREAESGVTESRTAENNMTESTAAERDSEERGSAESRTAESRTAERDAEERDSAENRTAALFAEREDASGYKVIEPDVVTGDRNDALPDLVLMAGACAAFAGMYCTRKRKERHGKED